MENYEIPIGERKINIVCERFKTRVKVLKIQCDETDNSKKIKENQDYTENLVNNEEIKKTFKDFFYELYSDISFKNQLYKIKDLKIEEKYKEGNISVQLYYLVFKSLLEIIKDDIYFIFGFKEIYKELLYKKFEISEHIHEKFNKDSTYKEMYLNSYLELTEFIKNNHGQLEDVEDIVKSIFYRKTKDGYELKGRFINNFDEVKEYIDNWFLIKGDYESVDILLELNKRKKRQSSFISKLGKRIFNSYTWLTSLLIPIMNYILFSITGYVFFHETKKYMWIFMYMPFFLIVLYEIFRFSADFSLRECIYIFTRRYYPRLLGAIIAGYALLLLGDEVYKYVINLSFIKIAIIGILALLLTFGYLYSEISNNVKEDEYIAKRTMNVFIKGLCHSYALIYVFNPLVITGFLRGLVADKVVYNDGIDMTKYYGDCFIINQTNFLDSIHHIKITILYPILALMIGIFLQILWEDEQITRPL